MGEVWVGGVGGEEMSTWNLTSDMTRHFNPFPNPTPHSEKKWIYFVWTIYTSFTRGCDTFFYAFKKYMVPLPETIYLRVYFIKSRLIYFNCINVVNIFQILSPAEEIIIGVKYPGKSQNKRST